MVWQVPSHVRWVYFFSDFVCRKACMTCVICEAFLRKSKTRIKTNHLNNALIKRHCYLSTGCRTKSDVALIIDTSRYMYRSRLRGVKRYIRSMLQRMEFGNGDNVRVAVVDYASNAYTRLSLESGRDQRNVMAAVASLRWEYIQTNVQNAVSSNVFQLI